MTGKRTAMVQITESDLDLLVPLAECRFMTIRQLAVLLNRNDRALARRLRLLVIHDVVRAARRGPSGVPGRPEQVFGLGEAGLAHLKAHGRALPDAEFELFAARQIDCMDHELLVSDVRVQSAQLAAVVPAIRGSFFTVRSWALCAPGPSRPPNLRESASHGSQESTEFVPDGALILRHVEISKTLLFFLEVDMGTEPLRSRRGGANLDAKIRNYRQLFASGRYRRYEAVAGGPLRGFRLLIICDGPAWLAKIGILARQSGPCDFVWAADRHTVAEMGLWGPIWHRASRNGPQAESILGSIAPLSGLGPERVVIPTGQAE